MPGGRARGDGQARTDLGSEAIRGRRDPAERGARRPVGLLDRLLDAVLGLALLVDRGEVPWGEEATLHPPAREPHRADLCELGAHARDRRRGVSAVGMGVGGAGTGRGSVGEHTFAGANCMPFFMIRMLVMPLPGHLAARPSSLARRASAARQLALRLGLVHDGWARAGCRCGGRSATSILCRPPLPDDQARVATPIIGSREASPACASQVIARARASSHDLL